MHGHAACGAVAGSLGHSQRRCEDNKKCRCTITNPFDSTMRSLLVAVYELGVNEIMVIGHTRCGVQGMNAEEMLGLMRKRGISE